MITFEEAFKLLKKKHPGIYIKSTFEAGTGVYCFVALRDPNNPRELDPFYSVDKTTGEVRKFAPAIDYLTFLDKLQKTNRELNDKL